MKNFIGEPQIFSDESTTFNCEPPNIGREPQNIACEPRNINAEPPSIAREPPNINAEPPNIACEPLNINAEPLNINAEPRNINAEPLNINAELQNINAESPNIVRELRNINDKPQSINDEPPNITHPPLNIPCEPQIFKRQPPAFSRNLLPYSCGETGYNNKFLTPIAYPPIFIPHPSFVSPLSFILYPSSFLLAFPFLEPPLSVVRVREHVNPLSKKYQTPATPPDWGKVYAVPEQPLHLDIGCGKGRFLLEMAQQQPTWNFLGLEIREPLVEQANQWRDELGLVNLFYVFCNANNSLRPILDSLPAGTLQRVTIQFPDPWFKRKHQKRRVVQPEMVNELADALPSGGVVFLQSDVEAVALEMRDRFSENPSFLCQHEGWLSTNPMPVPTEREFSTLSRGEAVYRVTFVVGDRG